MLEEDPQAEEIIARVAALDIGKAEVVCCVRVPHEGKPGRRLQEVETYSTMTRSLLGMADHLRCLGVTRVVMEATSDYWKPVFYLLEAQGLDPWLVNARDVKHLPGRPKTDRLDAVWLCKVAERQMIRPSFVPPPQIRRLRDVTRYRIDLVGVRTAEKQRVEKLLEDAQIKLSVVLAEALEGRFTDHHAQLARMLLGQLDDLTARIIEVTALLDAAIAALPAGSPSTDPATSTDAPDPAEGEGTPRPGPTPTGYACAVARLCAIPGAGPDTVRAVIGEIGLDMTVFGRHQRLCSWTKVAPRTVQSGRKNGRARTGEANPYLKAALAQMAIGAAKTDTFLGERYRRLVKRMPKAKALVALQRSILIIIFHLLADPTAEFTDLGPDYYTRRIDLTRRTNQLTRQLQALGYTVELTPTKTA